MRPSFILVKPQDALFYHTLLYYTILYYTILYYTILYYTILYCTVLYRTVLYDTMTLPFALRSSLIPCHSDADALVAGLLLNRSRMGFM